MASRKFRDDNYIVIQGWMVNVLHLSGTELVLYALIYGFSQDGGQCTAGLSYMAGATNSTRNTVTNNLKKLIEKRLLSKQVTEMNGVKFCAYTAIVPEEQNTDTEAEATKICGGTSKIGVGGTSKIEMGTSKIEDNNIYNKDNNIIKEKPITINSDCQKDESFCPAPAKSEAESDSKQKTLFCNSNVAKDLEKEDGTLDVEKMEQYFKAEATKDVDLEYYYRTVSDWSDSSNTKRTARGWMATIRTFIREDERRGHLRTITKEERKKRLNQMFAEVRKRYFGDTKNPDEEALWDALSMGDSNK